MHQGIIKFQFLMVRLKDKYGETTTVAFVIFQFLMVRLKASLAKLHPQLAWYFNSLWCD